VRNLLNRPYRHTASARKQSSAALFFGAFVFFFLAVFQPFQLNEYAGSTTLLALGYGLVTTAVMLLLNWVVQLAIVPNFFKEESWTLGREIFWTALNILLIGFGNVVYSWAIGLMSLNLQNLFWLLTYTVAVGVFPITIGILLNEVRLRKKFERESNAINQTIEIRHASPHASPLKPEHAVHIPSENQGESFAVAPKSLLLMKAAENYTEVFWDNQGTQKRSVVRANLKMLEDALVAHPQFKRCHKSYIVNLALVHHISGNAQGYKLHMEGFSAPIPVSRMLNNSIKNLLETYA
jgi:hypothetical protein